MGLMEDFAAALAHLERFINWRTRPEPGAGMGGIFPGEGTGTVNFEYTNWLRGYHDACIGLARAREPFVRAGWARRMQRERPNAGGGIRKALEVWDTRVPESVRRICNSHPASDSDEGAILARFQANLEIRLGTYVEAELTRMARLYPKYDATGNIPGPDDSYYLTPP